MAESDESGDIDATHGTGDGDDGPRKGGAGTIDRKLLEILVCPATKTTLVYDADRQELISRAARLAYPIRDGIPIMLTEEARELTDEELGS